MPLLTQANRALRISTPLGKDVLLLHALRGTEAMSRLFEFRLDVVATSSTQVEFDALLGQEVTASVELPDGGLRHVSGMVRRVVEGGRAVGAPDITGTPYTLEVVPRLWLLTLRRDSRIFQQINVPDVLAEVLSGFDVKFAIQGKYEPRNYCVQYQETDFEFVSRLMEEEGIFYFFEHSDGGHRLVLADTPISHPDLPGRATIDFDEFRGGVRDEARIYRWEKEQALRPGKYTLWDHNFELPGNNVEATVPIMKSVRAGTVTHKLDAGGVAEHEVYEYPGEYAKRFDGIDPGGSERASDLQKVFEDNSRTVGIRMQQEEVAALLIRGASDSAHLVPGHKFELAKHENGDGAYVVVAVHHEARLAEIGRSGTDDVFQYENTFTCIPHALPYRPPRTTPRPRVFGCQTATVVGPSGEEIFTDKYGRVKVQFHWDRNGKKDANSACWLRVGTPWAGKQWGMIHIPRIGHEVIVDFLEGDPDRPIITGMVYNPDYMPPWPLPDNRTRSGIRTRSTPDGGTETFNELRFEDRKDQEHIYLHAERNLRVAVERNEVHTVGQHQGALIRGARAVVVEGEVKVDLQAVSEVPEDGELDENGEEMVGDTLIVEKKRYTYVGDEELHEVEKGHGLHVLDGDQLIRVTTGDQVTMVDDGDQNVTIKGNQTTTLEQGSHSLTVELGSSRTRIKAGNHELKVDVGKSTSEAMKAIELKVGQSSIKIDPSGITLKGPMIKIEADALLEAKGGAMAKLEGGGMLIAKGALTMIN